LFLAVRDNISIGGPWANPLVRPWLFFKVKQIDFLTWLRRSS